MPSPHPIILGVVHECAYFYGNWRVKIPIILQIKGNKQISSDVASIFCLTFQNLRPNNLVMWEGIKSLMQRGADTLHLGRTSMENEGLRRFKLSRGIFDSTWPEVPG